MFVYFLVGSETPSYLGRLDFGYLSHQSLMELLISAIVYPSKICGSIDEKYDIDDWHGVYLNDSGEVTMIFWVSLNLKGPLLLEWLPSTVVDVNVTSNDLRGSIYTELLPRSIAKLFLASNSFEGTVSLTTLPPHLEGLRLEMNSLSGTLDLTGLPQALEILALCYNNFQGSLDFTKLPDGLMLLHVNANRFCGRSDLSKLPKSLLWFSVHDTQLKGEIARAPGFNISKSKVRFVEASAESSSP